MAGFMIKGGILRHARQDFLLHLKRQKNSANKAVGTGTAHRNMAQPLIWQVVSCLNFVGYWPITGLSAAIP